LKTATIATSVTRRAGGLFDSLLGTCRALSKLPDVRESILSLNDGPSPEDLERWQGVPLQRFSVLGPLFFGYSPELKPALLDGGFDLAHIHGIWQYPSIAVDAWHKQTRRPYVISPHGMLDPWALRNAAGKKRIALFAYEGHHLKHAACLRALCESEGRAIRAFGLTNPIAIIPNGIDLPSSDGSAKLIVDNPLRTLKADGRKVLLYLGRIHPKKGLVNLLKAWAEVQNPVVSGPAVRSQSCEWILAIAGWDQGGHEAELKQLATQLGIHWADVRAQRARTGERLSETFQPLTFDLQRPALLVFLGPRFNEAKAACYTNCDAFVLPSFSEGLPMAVLEAWAYGKPVLMTHECNLPEGFASEAALRIAPSAEGVEAGLRDLFAMNDASRLARGANGRAMVATRFTWPKIARDIRSVYDWLLGGGPPASSVLAK
jgi:glycosyltransferase involved in cell wall biosynthesis